ncbi:MAG: winged helix-turn-helix domain-containing protein [Candidatus Eisenbacteria bacterium]
MPARQDPPHSPRSGDDPRVYRFGSFVLDVADRRLSREDEVLSLHARAFDVLVQLVRHGGRLVTKDQLLDSVWSELAVEENNIQVQVSALRRLLGPGWIVTVPGRGYRFSGEVAPAAANEVRDIPAPAFTRLPEPASTLIGRDSDLAALESRVAEARLVTLVGPGGVGKTRLALEVARRIESRVADGCAWIDLGAIAEPRMVAESTAAALGLSPAERDPIADLIKWLAARDTLLILDNAEHLVESLAPLAARVLAETRRVRLLVTSQIPCRLPGEHVHRLDPLALPSPDAAAEAVAASAAVSLFVARARAQIGDFHLDTANAPTVAKLCRQLDGVPLALEIAAGRLPSLGLEALVARLDQRFRVLVAGSRTAPQRQRTLQSLFDWSYGLLGADEQAVFRRLGLLGHDFSLEDAIEIARGDRLDEWAVVEILSDLVDRSLVMASADEPPRYSLLDSGRAYARSRIDPAIDATGVERAITRLEQRAVSAAARSENGEALRAAFEALDRVQLLAPGSSRDARELELCLALGPVVQTTVGPAHPRAEAIYRRATELARALPPGERGFMAQWGLWHFLAMAGRDREAADSSREIVALADTLGDDALTLEAEHARLSTAQLLGDTAQVVASAARVEERYDRVRHRQLAARFGGHDPAVCALGQGSGRTVARRTTRRGSRGGRARLGAGCNMTTPTAARSGTSTPHSPGARGVTVALRRRHSRELAILCERHSMDMLSSEAMLLAGRARWEERNVGGISDMERARRPARWMRAATSPFAFYRPASRRARRRACRRGLSAPGESRGVRAQGQEGSSCKPSGCERYGVERSRACKRRWHRSRKAGVLADALGAYALTLRAALSRRNACERSRGRNRRRPCRVRAVVASGARASSRTRHGGRTPGCRPPAQAAVSRSRSFARAHERLTISARALAGYDKSKE